MTADRETWILRAPSTGATWKRRGVPDLPPYSPIVTTPVEPPPTGGGPTTPPLGPDSVKLPFNLEAIRAAMAASPRKCFAHYFVTFPISFNNSTDYYGTTLNPGGAAMPATDTPFEGQTRDKPSLALTRPLKRAETNWKDLDRLDEVKQGIEAGLDGWMPDVLQVIQAGAGQERWDQILETMRAVNLVNNPNFKIAPMPDSLASATRDPVILADHMAIMAKDPSAFKLPTGEFVLSPYAPERAPAGAKTWGHDGWATVLDRLRTFHGIRTLFNPCFLDSWTADPQAPTFLDLSWMMSRWGDGDPVMTGGTSVNNRGAPAKAHASPTALTGTVGYGVKWMHPIRFGDTRPNQGNFFESVGFECLVESWKAAIDGGADWAQIPTWSDMAEHANIQPSRAHGWVYLDVNAYFMARWKLGYYPTIIRDAVYVSHRIQLSAGTTYTGRATRVQTLRTGGSALQDTVSVACFLTAPATVNVKVGTTTTPLTAPAGFSTHRVPLKLGAVSAEAVRSGAAVAAVVSPHKVLSSLIADDWNYYAAGSLR